MPRSLATYTAVAALTLGLAGGLAAAPAFADTPARPALCVSLDAAVKAVGTATDTLADKEAALADANSKVTELAGVLNGIGAGDPGFDQANSDLEAAKLAAQHAEEAKNLAEANVTGAAQNKSNVLSAIATAGINCDPATTEPTPAPTSSPVVTTVPASVFTDDKDCGDFDSQEAAQAFFLAHRSATQSDPDRLDANNNGIACEGAYGDSAPRTVTASTTEINNGVVVNPTKDDGSVATTSGNEVTDVPAGSAQTGGL